MLERGQRVTGAGGLPASVLCDPVTDPFTVLNMARASLFLDPSPPQGQASGEKYAAAPSRGKQCMRSRHRRGRAGPSLRLQVPQRSPASSFRH
mgnify:CR=1 FL=1